MSDEILGWLHGATANRAKVDTIDGWSTEKLYNILILLRFSGIWQNRQNKGRLPLFSKALTGAALSKKILLCEAIFSC
jgi:hypothetical protein